MAPSVLAALVLVWAAGLFLGACSMDADSGGSTPSAPAGLPDTPDAPDAPPAPPVPALKGGPTVSYAEDGAVSVTFAFDMDVVADEPEGWDIAGNGTAVITASPRSPFAPGPATLRLTAANKEYPERVRAVEAGAVLVGGVFSRPDEETAYDLAYYDENGAAGLALLVPGSRLRAGGTNWVYVANDYFKNIFNAVAAPNEPGARGLFHIIIGAEGAGADKIEIAGASLQGAGTAAKPAVIHAGLPEGDNSGLPPYVIPYRGLGSPGKGYPHLRIQVNRGASLVILADNTGYEAGGAGNPCPPGYFKGTVEVMGGGSLRDGAYEGFPLGAESVIIARLGSRLAVGPETSFNPGGAGYVASRDKYFSGWLVGSAGDAPRIVWGTGDQNGDYIEIRGGKLAFSANVTVKKTLALDVSVWFVNGPSLAIDAAGDSLAIAGRKGLFARDGGRKFYGDKSSSGGQNPGAPAAKIILKEGSALHRSFLIGGDPAEGEEFIEADGGLSVSNRGSAEGGPPLVFYKEGSAPIFGYLNWELPPAGERNIAIDN
jgi:hypothetical protein